MVVEQRSFRRDYIPLSRMPPHLPLAVIAAEDGKFATHGGFDWEAIKEAWANQRGGGSWSSFALADPGSSRDEQRDILRQLSRSYR
jgi:membrane peptidoglycan carboxypeptidase